MPTRLAARMSRLGTEGAFEVLARAQDLEARGRDVVHLEIGEPDFTPPPHIIEAGIRALRAGDTHYTPAAGLPELREAIAGYVGRTRGVDIDAAQVVVAPGAKPILFAAVLALAGPGDEVIYPDPGFPIYESVIRFAGAVPIPLPLTEDRDFGVDTAALEARVSARTRLVIVNAPHNPTGGTLTSDVLDRLAELAVEHDFMVLSDEIYSRIIYDGEPDSIARRTGMIDRTIIVDGFSKTYAMTGWRIGYGVMPHRLAEAVTRLGVNSYSCTPGFTQRAPLAALHGPQDAVDEMVAAFRVRRDALVAGLNAIRGIRCRVPAGAFYAFPNISALGISSAAFADRLLAEWGVAVLPGTAFGSAGEGYLRLSYATSMVRIEDALARIRAAIEAG